MNKAIIMGRLTDDPVVRHTQDGKAVASYTLAVDRRWARSEQKADFIPCKAWESKGEFAEKYLHKGTKILVMGRIQTGSYKDRDGRTVYTTDVVVEEQEFAESKGAQPGNAPQETAQEAPQIKTDNEGFIDVNSLPQTEQEELPFA
jgi:single-strand DNA-binding protein